MGQYGGRGVCFCFSSIHWLMLWDHCMSWFLGTRRIYLPNITLISSGILAQFVHYIEMVPNEMPLFALLCSIAYNNIVNKALIDSRLCHLSSSHDDTYWCLLLSKIWLESWLLCAQVFIFDPLAPCYKNMLSSTKPEILNAIRRRLAHGHRRRT